MEATEEAWDVSRRYREFTQLRKRLLRLGIDVPTLATSFRDSISAETKSQTGVRIGDPTPPDLPKKTWRSNKFDKGHLESRQAALEAYLRGVVEVGGSTC